MLHHSKTVTTPKCYNTFAAAKGVVLPVIFTPFFFLFTLSLFFGFYFYFLKDKNVMTRYYSTFSLLKMIDNMNHVGVPRMLAAYVEDSGD